MNSTPQTPPPRTPRQLLVGLLTATSVWWFPAHAETPTYTLESLRARAQRESPAVVSSLAARAVSEAGRITARAYPNPSISLDTGRLGPRGSSTDAGAALSVSISQPIENPLLRRARIDSAQARLDLVDAQTLGVRSELNAAVRDAFFALVRWRAQVSALREDLLLAEQIRDRIAVRVRAGEAPRFDVLRAENEVAGVRANLEATLPKVRQSLLDLRRLVSPQLEAEFDVQVTATDTQILSETDYIAMKYAVIERNPEISQARRAVQVAERQVELERHQRMPRVELRATHDRDPTMSLTRMGAQLVLPLLDRREGPLAEATADAERSRRFLEQRRFDADAAFERAWQAYQAALAKVTAIDGGILERARQVLSIAEAAYRLGERGIIEYLDAQRQFRIVRNELLEARFDLQHARTELERLAGR